MLGHAALTACSSRQCSTPQVWAASFSCSSIEALKSCAPVTQALENGVIQLMTIGHVHLTYVILIAKHVSCCTDRLKPCHAMLRHRMTQSGVCIHRLCRGAGVCVLIVARVIFVVVCPLRFGPWAISITRKLKQHPAHACQCRNRPLILSCRGLHACWARDSCLGLQSCR